MTTTPQDPSALPLQREGETPEERDARFYGEPVRQPEPEVADPGVQGGEQQDRAEDTDNPL
jgi:hypothetical protein